MYDHVDDHDVGLSASLLVPEVPEVLDSCHAKVGTEAHRPQNRHHQQGGIMWSAGK